MYTPRAGPELSSIQPDDTLLASEETKLDTVLRIEL